MNRLPATASPAPVTTSQHLARLALGAFVLGAGISHLTWARREFQAQVPEWVPMDPDAVVLASGVVEVLLGGALIARPRERVGLGLLAAAFFVAVFPGNISQYVTRTSAFGLDTDAKRFARLFFQPVFVAWALWSSGAWTTLRERR